MSKIVRQRKNSNNKLQIYKRMFQSYTDPFQCLNNSKQYSMTQTIIKASAIVNKEGQMDI